MPGREGLQDERARGIVPFDQFPGPVVIPPADIQDDPGLCLRVNATWAALLSSLLDRLDQPDVWAGDETQIDDARQRVRALQVLLDGINDCMCIDDFTASAESGTPVSVTYDPETGNFHFVIPPGEKGDTGSVGPAGPAGPAGASGSGVITESAPDLSEGGTVDARCRLSTWLRGELIDTAERVLDAFDELGDIVDAAGSLIGNIPSVPTWIAEYMFVGLGIASAATTAVIRAQFTTAFWDDVQCSIHCSLDTVDPVFDATVRDLAVLEIGNASLAAQFISALLLMQSDESLAWQTWRAQFQDTSSLNCGFCSACEPWSVSWFDGDGNAVPPWSLESFGGVYPTYDAINDWLVGAERGPGIGDDVGLIINFASSVTITRVRVETAFYKTRSQTDDIARVELDNVNVANSTNAVINTALTGYAEWNGAQSVDKIRVWGGTRTTDIGDGGYIRITKLIVEGTGDNPFD